MAVLLQILALNSGFYYIKVKLKQINNKKNNKVYIKNRQFKKRKQKLVIKFKNFIIKQKQFLQLNLKICTIPIFRKP